MKLTITGYSTALFSTWYFIEELGLLFEADDGVTASLLQKARKIEHVFISHADRDRGDTWKELSNSPADIFAIHFMDNKKGFAFGRGNYSGGDFGYSYGSIYCTDNGGISWSGSADEKEAGVILSVSFPTSRIGYGVAGNRVTRFTIK